jgi:MFS family permease
LIITTKEQGAAVFLLAGVGNAASLVLTIPLMGDLVPRRHIGAATGILAGSGSLAAPIASLAAGTLSDAYGPRVIFLLMSVCVGIALLLLPFVHPLATEASETPAQAPSLLIVEDSPPEALPGI